MEFTDILVGSPNTVKTQSCLFKKHIAPHLSPEKAKSASIVDIKGIMNKWDKLAPRTNKMLLGLLQRYVAFCGGYVETKGLYRGLQINQDKPKALTKKNAELFLKTCEKIDPELYPIVLLATHCGLRKGEIFGLRNEDIDLAKKTITIRHSYDSTTKNKKSRIVLMSNTVYKQLHKRNYLNSKDLVFKRFEPHRRIKKVFSKIGINDKSCHSLRHTFATLGLNSKNNIKQIQDALGHSSLSTTIDLYWSNIDLELDLDFLPGDK